MDEHSARLLFMGRIKAKEEIEPHTSKIVLNKYDTNSSMNPEMTSANNSAVLLPFTFFCRYFSIAPLQLSCKGQTIRRIRRTLNTSALDTMLSPALIVSRIDARQTYTCSRRRAWARSARIVVYSPESGGSGPAARASPKCCQPQ